MTWRTIRLTHPAGSALPPLSVDARLVIAARGVRAFAYGLLGVLLGVALSQRELSPVGIGAIITVSLVGDFVGTYLIGLHADRRGRRWTLAVPCWPALWRLREWCSGLFPSNPSF